MALRSCRQKSVFTCLITNLLSLWGSSCISEIACLTFSKLLMTMTYGVRSESSSCICVHRSKCPQPRSNESTEKKPCLKLREKKTKVEKIPTKKENKNNPHQNQPEAIFSYEGLNSDFEGLLRNN